MKIIIILVPAVILSGCATAFSPSHDPITFTSTPEGAVVFVDGNRIGRTPTTVPIKRQLTPPRVEVKAEGYYPANVVMQNSFNAVSLWDIFLWPTFFVDVATGNIMKASQFNYNAELEPQVGYSAPSNTTSPIINSADMKSVPQKSNQMWGGKQ